MSTLLAYLLWSYLLSLPKAEPLSPKAPCSALRPTFSEKRIAKSAVAWGHRKVGA